MTGLWRDAYFLLLSFVLCLIGATPVFRDEIGLREWVKQREDAGKDRSYEEVSEEAKARQQKFIDRDNDEIMAKFVEDHGRTMTVEEREELLIKNKFKASYTWYYAFLERQQLLNLSLSSTKKMTKHEWKQRMSTWLPQERFYLLTNHADAISTDGYVNRNLFFNYDEVPIQFEKHQRKQATTVENKDVRIANHKASTGDSDKRFATLLLTLPMASWDDGFLRPGVDCRPYVLMRG